MLERLREGVLTAAEKPIVKALLAKRWRNQDIQALVNMGRGAKINSARVTEIENDATIIDAADDADERVPGKGVLRSKADRPLSTKFFIEIPVGTPASGFLSIRRIAGFG